MSVKKRMKLCSNCDGFVDLDVIICPYCGSDVLLSEETIPDLDETPPIAHYRKKMSVEETLSSLYPPPYKPKNIHVPNPMNPDPLNPDPLNPNTVSSRQNDVDYNNLNHQQLTQKDEETDTCMQDITKLDETKKMFSFSRALPILLFSLGVNILLLGLYLLIFSTNGEIFIRWNAAIWYVYLLVGVPFIIVGYKMLSKSS